MTACIYVRAPDHLGDGVLALPAIASLAARSALVIEGPDWSRVLYRHLLPAVQPRDAPQFAVLLKPSFGAAWRSRRYTRRFGLRTDHRAILLTDPVPPGSGHRQEDLDAVARAAGGQPSGAPRFPTTPEDFRSAPLVDEGCVLLLPGSASGETVEWPFFRALASALASNGHDVWFAGGPNERDRMGDLAGVHPVLPELGIAAFAATATRAKAVVGNDSGLTHLAAAARRAAGVDVASVHVICGGTDPARTAAPGATTYQPQSPPSCWPCYKKSCRASLECMSVEVDTVLTKLLNASRDCP